MPDLVQPTSRSMGMQLNRFAKFLKGISEICMMFCPEENEALNVYADADFTSNWLNVHAEFDPAMAKSRSCLIITYANGPMLLASKMQLQVALSTTKAEYISLSSALRDVITQMDLAKELWDKFNFDIFCSNIDVFCMFLRITLVHLKLPSFQRCNLEPNISIFSIITLENMSGKVRLSFMPLAQSSSG